MLYTGLIRCLLMMLLQKTTAQSHTEAGWATHIIAFILLGTLAIPAVILKPRTLPLKKRTLLDFSTFKNISYMLFSFALFLIFTDLYIFFFYIFLYAAEYLSMINNFVFYLLIIMNVALLLFYNKLKNCNFCKLFHENYRNHIIL